VLDSARRTDGRHRPSGSGKSSLAFDVVFAEGQRRFMETLTPYARQFLPTLPRTRRRQRDGGAPSIAPRATHGARRRQTRPSRPSPEIAHYLRLLFAKLGDIHCPECDALGRPSVG